MNLILTRTRGQGFVVSTLFEIQCFLLDLCIRFRRSVPLSACASWCLSQLLTLLIFELNLSQTSSLLTAIYSVPIDVLSRLFLGSEYFSLFLTQNQEPSGYSAPAKRRVIRGFVFTNFMNISRRDCG